MAIMEDGYQFGECGLQDCGDCAAQPTCPSAKKEKAKMGTKRVMTYRLIKMPGGRVAIVKAGFVKCSSGKPVKKVKPKASVDW